MIEARTGATVHVTADGPPGIAGQMGIRIERPDGTTHTARTTDGIVEVEAGSGVYAKALIAPDEAGNYIILWDDGAATPDFASEDLIVRISAVGMPEPPAGWPNYLPNVAQVAALIRSRTRRRGSGEEIGTFTDEEPVTRPTEEQAIAAIQEAATEVMPTIGQELPQVEGPDPDALKKMASSVVALLAAMTIESSFYPEQVETGRSNYPALERRYNKALARLVDATAAAGGSVAGDEGEAGGGWMRPSYDFGDHDQTTMTEKF